MIDEQELLRRVRLQRAIAMQQMAPAPDDQLQKQAQEQIAVQSRVPQLPVQQPQPQMPQPVDATQGTALNSRAAQLEQQAQPAPGPKGFKENLVNGLTKGMEAFANPRTYAQLDMQRQGMEQQRQQDLLAKAQQLRGQATQQNQFEQNQHRLDVNEAADQNYRNRNLTSEDAMRQAQIGEINRKATAPTVHNVPAGGEMVVTSPAGDVLNTVAGPPRPDAANKSGQSKEVTFRKDTDLFKSLGNRGMVDYNPDLSAPARFSYKGQDVTDQVEGEYHQPSSTVQLNSAQQGDIPAWVELVTSGQVELSAVPQTIRSDVATATNATGQMIVPRKVRESLTDLGKAKNLLQPIRQLMDDIKAGKNAVENSLLLEKYTGSIGTLLARSVGGERGVVTDQDVKRALGIMPGWKATNFAPEYAEKEFQFLNGIIANQETAYKEGYFNKVGKTNEVPTESKAVNVVKWGKDATGKPIRLK